MLIGLTVWEPRPTPVLGCSPGLEVGMPKAGDAGFAGGMPYREGGPEYSATGGSDRVDRGTDTTRGTGYTPPPV